MKRYTTTIIMTTLLLTLTACGGSKNTQDGTAGMTPVGPAFMADSAYRYCEEQCQFGPRTMNSEAHELCGQWIAGKFRSFGLQVTEQRANLKGYDGTMLKSTNIIASYRPELTDRVMLCAHWDSRPWADNDPDEQNWKKPVMAANDGASGVGIMIEIARLLNDGEQMTGDSTATQRPLPNIGIDFICFDAEDWGVPQWSDAPDASDSWALGAQHWSAQPHADGYKPRYGILLDMVGGQGARFYRELYSKDYAPSVVKRVWQAAQVVGFGSFFPQKDGGRITDDHVPVNQVAGIPCIDIIPYYPDCEASSFGPTWHTLNDDMQHLDRTTLQAVGQTLVQVLFSE
jgi:hypothetical protein